MRAFQQCARILIFLGGRDESGRHGTLVPAWKVVNRGSGRFGRHPEQNQASISMAEANGKSNQ